MPKLGKLNIQNRYIYKAAISLDRMAWHKPQFTKGRVDAAAQILATETAPTAEWEEAVMIINNWRSSHAYPLQALKMTLLKRARNVDKSALVSQRLKRLKSIRAKLNRYSGMQLSRMHDIGGCRAVLKSASHVDRLLRAYRIGAAKNPTGRAELVREYDYITEPKDDGYRSVHLVFKYGGRSPKHACYNGLRIEVQIRSRLQHTWATAVETVDLFTGQTLKSNIGKLEWKRFFALMGSEMAEREKRPLVPGTPTDRHARITELRKLCQDLDLANVLAGWTVAVKLATPKASDHQFLLILDTENKSIDVRSFSRERATAASMEYLEIEKASIDNPNIQVVLVSVDSIKALRTAYPSFYLDTTRFLGVVNRVLSE